MWPRPAQLTHPKQYVLLKQTKYNRTQDALQLRFVKYCSTWCLHDYTKCLQILINTYVTYTFTTERHCSFILLIELTSREGMSSSSATVKAIVKLSL